MTIGLLIQTILFILTLICAGLVIFYILYEKDWMLTTALSMMVILYLCSIVLGFIHERFPKVWNALL